MSSLSRFAAFVRQNHIEEYARRSVEYLIDHKAPILSSFAHLSKEQMVQTAIKSADIFLTSLEDGTAFEVARKSREQWELDTIPNIPQRSIQPSDLVFVYAAQKHSLRHLIIRYTRDPEEIIDIIHELDEYYNTIQNEAVQLLFKIQKDAEQKLEAKNRQLEEAQSVAHIGSWEWSPADKSIVWTDEMYRIFGLVVSIPVTEEKLINFLTPASLSENKEKFMEGIKLGHPFSYEHTITRENGELRTLL